MEEKYIRNLLDQLKAVEHLLNGRAEAWAVEARDLLAGIQHSLEGQIQDEERTTREREIAWALKTGDYIPGSGEEPTEIFGRRLLWVWQPATGDKRYLDLDQDRLLTDDECLELTRRLVYER